jgi:hypothetical protein
MYTVHAHARNRLFTYVDKPENKVLQVDFDSKAWERGQFAASGITANPWKSSASNSAPFDQPFYIIMNVSTFYCRSSSVLGSVARQALQ